MGLFDVHAHLTSPAFDDVDEVIERAKNAGLSTIISNGLNIVDNERVLALSQKHSLVRPALGFYPVDTVLSEMLEMGIDYPREVEMHSAEETIAWLKDHLSDAVAVGEIGLDHYWVPEALWEKQEAIFRQLVTVAMDAAPP